MHKRAVYASDIFKNDPNSTKISGKTPQDLVGFQSDSKDRSPCAQAHACSSKNSSYTNLCHSFLPQCTLLHMCCGVIQIIPIEANCTGGAGAQLQKWRCCGRQSEHLPRRLSLLVFWRTLLLRVLHCFFPPSAFFLFLLPQFPSRKFLPLTEILHCRHILAFRVCCL